MVDEVIMERHTRGIDPFNGLDYGDEEFPEEHRCDPETELPVFNRYIAGSRRRIPWPWEKSAEASEEQDTKEPEKPLPQGRMDRYIKTPLKRLRSMLPGSKKEAQAEKQAQEERARRKEEEARQKEEETIREGPIVTQQPFVRSIPDEKPLDDIDEVTGRNLAEPNPQVKSFVPTLLYPPHPPEVFEEIADEAREKIREATKKAKDEMEAAEKTWIAEKLESESKPVQPKKQKRDPMKTPMQLRWELQRAKLEREAKPMVTTEELLLALGQHLKAKGKGLPQRRVAEDAEVD